jgi:glyoxylase-like metal-dependent hydrolase (beta-lactamase superfamily II)
MTRREFIGSSLAVSMAPQGLKSGPWMAQFEAVTPHLQIFHDVVNVAVIRRNRRALLIGSGEGVILESAKNAGMDSIGWVLYNDHHRDQCSGAARLQQAGAKIAVPASEAKFFGEATEIWQGADEIIYDRMNFRPDLFILRSSVAPDRDLQPNEVFTWEGLEIKVLPAPGPTDGSVTYVVDLDGIRIAFTGDLIYGPGQLWNMYSLQKRFPGMAGDYWGFGGAIPEMLKSLDLVLSQKPSVLIPSHGEVMRNPDQAVRLLREGVNAVLENYFVTSAWRLYHVNHDPNFKQPVMAPYNVPTLSSLPAANLPNWLHRSVFTSSYIQAEDKMIFLFDCGSESIIRELDQLMRSGVISGVEGIWISHYHDDHLQSVNAVRRKYGAKVYVQKELQDILENPRAYSMPALVSESIHVDHAFSEGEVLNWKGYRMTAYYFPGQTLHHDGLLIERDGTRVFMTGDSFANWGIDDYCSYNRNFLGHDGETAGYLRCLRLLLKLKPDILMAAHWGPEPVSEEYLQKTLQLLEERERLLASLFPWDDPNFGLDPSWVRAYPYHQTILPGQVASLEARIFNHSSLPQRASVHLHAPPGWQVNETTPLTISPHTEGSIRLTAIAPVQVPFRRQVLGLAVEFGGRKLGEIAEAIIDFLRS